MSRILNKLIRLADNKNTPIILYDSLGDRAVVLMNLDLYERNFLSDEEDFSHSHEEELCSEDEDVEELELEEKKSLSDVFPEEDNEDEGIERTNEELALWKAKREEKEREEIERALEEELQEYPPADPFEEDFLHTPEWHTISNETLSETEEEGVEEKKEIPSVIEPSYHPMMSNGTSLSWSDWTIAEPHYTPIPRKKMDNLVFEKTDTDASAEEILEEPIFLEEPIS